MASEYAGRTIDVAAFAGSDYPGEKSLATTLAEPGLGGKITTGIVKLGQRFLLELLTPLGSMPFLPARGSSLMIAARQGVINTPAALRREFSIALLTVKNNLRFEETAATPLDERLRDADIVSATYSSGNAVVSVRVTSADPSATIILPVALTL